ncbi:MAG: hypothetical protein Kow00117_00590 [Phototrophicales bacterium]
MRVPGWLIALAGLGSFIFLTLLCSFVSYSFTRQAVIDAREQGLEVSSIQELVDFVLNPPNADEAAAILLSGINTSSVINTPVPFEVQPTATPAYSITPLAPRTPNAPQPTAEVIADPNVVFGYDRINILLMGIDQRGDEIEDRFRTDTMILVQIDPVRKAIGVLSFPRDLWVQIPGFQSNRINTANYLGDGAELPGRGPGLAMETIRVNFGIPVQKYIMINFDVFFAIVNTIAPDGVEICVTEEIYDPKYPDGGRGTIEVRFEPGCQTMNAERLLQYARTRATFGGDFDRNRRQQEVLRAVQNEVLSAGGIRNFVEQIPTLYNQLAGSYRTNLTLEEILALAVLLSEIPQDNITFGAINELHVTPALNAEGDQILIPNYNQIRFVIQQTFDPQPDLSLADLQVRAAEEEATIMVYNNTSISGLAGQTRDWLTSRGVNVLNVASADPPANIPEVFILDFTGNPWTTRYLAELMGLPQSAIQPGAGSNIQTNADVVILVGSSVQELLAAN